MKKNFLLILFSAFAFGQNFEVLTKANHSDESFVKEFSSYMLPNYKLTSSSKKGVNAYYSYLPNNVSNEELKECDLGNKCEKEVVLTFKNINSVYKFDSATGEGEALKNFWSNNIQEITPNQKDNFIYKNSENTIWWTLFNSGQNWMIRNMSK